MCYPLNIDNIQKAQRKTHQILEIFSQLHL